MYSKNYIREQYLETTKSPNVDDFIKFWEIERRKEIQEGYKSEDSENNTREAEVYKKQYAVYQAKERREKIRELKDRGLFRDSHFERNI